MAILVCRQKAVSVTNHPAGPYRCAEESELTTTPDEECATVEELFQKAVNQYAEAPCLGITIKHSDIIIPPFIPNFNGHLVYNLSC